MPVSSASVTSPVLADFTDKSKSTLFTGIGSHAARYAALFPLTGRISSRPAYVKAINLWHARVCWLSQAGCPQISGPSEAAAKRRAYLSNCPPCGIKVQTSRMRPCGFNKVCPFCYARIVEELGSSLSVFRQLLTPAIQAKTFLVAFRCLAAYGVPDRAPWNIPVASLITTPEAVLKTRVGFAWMGFHDVTKSNKVVTRLTTFMVFREPPAFTFKCSAKLITQLKDRGVKAPTLEHYAPAMCSLEDPGALIKVIGEAASYPLGMLRGNADVAIQALKMYGPKQRIQSSSGVFVRKNMFGLAPADLLRTEADVPEEELENGTEYNFS